MDKKETSEQFQAGVQSAKFKSHKEALLRAILHGSIIAIALTWPTAWWKRIVGLVVAFFLVGAFSQYRAIRRGRS
jgi:hypothetical protein